MSNVMSVILPFIPVFSLIAAIVYRNWYTPPLKIGPHRCEDAKVNYRTILFGLGLLILSGLLAAIGAVWNDANDLRAGLSAFVLALFAALWGGLTLHWVWCQRRVANPGTLVTSEWPLVPGRTVELVYERQLRPGALADRAAGTISVGASLSLEEYESRRWNSRWVSRSTMQLNGWLDDAGRKAWQVDVPDNNVPRRRFGLPIPQAQFRWVLRVTLNIPQQNEERPPLRETVDAVGFVDLLQTVLTLLFGDIEHPIGENNLSSTFYMRFRLPPEASPSA